MMRTSTLKAGDNPLRLVKESTEALMKEASDVKVLDALPYP